MRFVDLLLRFVEPCHVSALLMNLHLRGLEVVQLSPDDGLVSRSQPGPRLVSRPVIILAVQNLVKYIYEIKQGLDKHQIKFDLPQCTR